MTKAMNTDIIELLADKDILVLSPHCDDAAFCMAGLIKRLDERGAKIHIVNIFTVSAFVATMENLNTEEVTKIRQAEDQRYHDLYSSTVTMQWLDELDAPLRDGHSLQTVCTGGDFTADDFALVAKVKESITAYCHKDCVVFAPATIGDHIDHRIIRLLALELNSELGMPCFLYEDMPYATSKDLDFLDAHIDSSKAKLDRYLEPIYSNLSTQLDFKQQCILCYESQIQQLDAAKIIAHASKFTKASTVERFWQVC